MAQQKLSCPLSASGFACGNFPLNVRREHGIGTSDIKKFCQTFCQLPLFPQASKRIYRRNSLERKLPKPTTMRSLQIEAWLANHHRVISSFKQYGLFLAVHRSVSATARLVRELIGGKQQYV
jgi:hypothetical protein